MKANPANIKMAAGIMGAYFAYACLNNYLEHMAETGESDFYGAIMGAFKDLTVTAIKAAASILFGKWVEPFSYFGVDNIVELYPLLRSEKVQKIEVTPAAYDNNGAGQVDLTSGAGTFVIDLTPGAVTTYTASYAEHPRYVAEGSNPTTFDLTLTFTANGTQDLFRVDSTYTEHTPWGEDRTGTKEECIIFYEYLSALRDYELRAIRISHGTFNTVIFNVERVLLP